MKVQETFLVPFNTASLTWFGFQLMPSPQILPELDIAGDSHSSEEWIVSSLNGSYGKELS